MLLAVLLSLVLPLRAQTICSQSTTLPALYPSVSVQPSQTGILAAQNVQSGTVLLSIGMSNTTQLFSKLDPAVTRLTLVDGAQGGCVARKFAQATHTCWSGVTSALSAKGKTASDVSVVWIMAVNPARTSQSVSSYVSGLSKDLNNVVKNVRTKYGTDTLILMSGLHHEVYAPKSSIQPEPHAWESSNIVNSIVAANSDVDWGPYLWNPAPQARADGMNITCAMASGTGGVHLTSGGSQYAASWFETWFSTNPIGQALQQ
jgi:hypothetical protein